MVLSWTHTETHFYHETTVARLRWGAIKNDEESTKNIPTLCSPVMLQSHTRISYSIFLLQKLKVIRMVKNFYAIYGTSSSQESTIRSYTESAESHPTTCLLYIHYNSILPPKLKSLYWSLHSILYAFLIFPCVLRILPTSFYSIWAS
jgi:hypothetical protein